jgi:hypothetical protein
LNIGVSVQRNHGESHRDHGNDHPDRHCDHRIANMDIRPTQGAPDLYQIHPRGEVSAAKGRNLDIRPMPMATGGCTPPNKCPQNERLGCAGARRRDGVARAEGSIVTLICDGADRYAGTY